MFNNFDIDSHFRTAANEFCFDYLQGTGCTLDKSLTNFAAFHT